MAIKPIQILITAKDQASAVFGSLQAKVAAVGTAIAGYFSVQAFAGIIRGAGNLEEAMSRVQAATGASGKELEALRATAVATGNSTQFSSVQAANALENLAKAGLSANDAIATLPAVIKLAQAGDLDLATSTEFVTKAVMGLGLAFTEAGRVADVLALGANATNTSVTGLAQALSYAAPVAQSLGLSLESTVAIIGKFADAGIDASRAGTALNSILSQFGDPASKFRQELAAAGITTSNFEKALHELGASGAAGERAINAIGQEAGPALRALLNQGLGALDELTLKLKSAEGSAAATAATMRNNLNGALSTLAGVWESVVVALGTPVLPVLKQGVEQLSDALRSAVSDGTIGRFGTALATAFEGAIKWVREFVASVDFTEVTTRVQNFADRADEVFKSLGESARTASSIAQTAWGVMVAGTNSVLAVIYKLGEGFSNVANNIQRGLALLLEGLARISLGNVSAAFKQAAEEVRLSAEATGAVAAAFGQKAGEAFDRAAEGARTAQEGFAGLSDSAKQSASAAVAATDKYKNVVQGLIASAEAAGIARQKTEAAAAAQKKAAQETAAAITKLRDEYQKAIDTGNVQLAAEKLRELERAAKAAGDAAVGNSKKQKEAAADIAAAFERAGVASKASLQVFAQTARSDFEKIRDSGQANADGIAKAWAKAAEAAIAANDGVVPYWVQGEAAAKGYIVQVDDAGKATLQLVQTGAALSGLAGGFDAAAAAAQGYGKAVQGIRSPGGGRGAGGGGGGRGGGGGYGSRGGFDQLQQNREDGYSDRNVFTIDPNAARLAEANASASASLADREKRLEGQNAVDMSLQFKLRDKLKAGTLGADDVGDLKAVVKSLQQQAEINGSADKLSAGFISLEGRRDATSWQVTKQQFEDAIRKLAARDSAVDRPQVRPGGSVPSAAGNIVSNITIGGVTRSVQFADEESARTTEDLLRQLAQARGTA